jgi:hypothetical protein
LASGAFDPQRTFAELQSRSAPGKMSGGLYASRDTRSVARKNKSMAAKDKIAD